MNISLSVMKGITFDISKDAISRATTNNLNTHLVDTDAAAFLLAPKANKGCFVQIPVGSRIFGQRSVPASHFPCKPVR